MVKYYLSLHKFFFKDGLLKVKQNDESLPSGCYYNSDNFLCCSQELENIMNKTYYSLVESRGGKWKKNNFHQISVCLIYCLILIYFKIFFNIKFLKG